MPLSHVLGSICLKSMPEPDHQNLAGTARAFGLSDSQGTRLLTATASTSAARLGDFGPLSLVSLALASARTTWRGEALLQATAARASAKAQQPSPQGLGNLAWGMATALVPDKSSLEVLTLEARTSARRERERESATNNPPKAP